MHPAIAFALPGGALAFAAAGSALHSLSMWRFDQRHPGLRRRTDDVGTARSSAEPVPTAVAVGEASDEVRADVTTSTNQNAQQPAPHPTDVFNIVLPFRETVERLQRAGPIVTSDPPVTLRGQLRARSNMLPPRPIPRSPSDHSPAPASE